MPCCRGGVSFRHHHAGKGASHDPLVSRVLSRRTWQLLSSRPNLYSIDGGTCTQNQGGAFPDDEVAMFKVMALGLRYD